MNNNFCLVTHYKLLYNEYNDISYHVHYSKYTNNIPAQFFCNFFCCLIYETQDYTHDNYLKYANNIPPPSILVVIFVVVYFMKLKNIRILIKLSGITHLPC